MRFSSLCTAMAVFFGIGAIAAAAGNLSGLGHRWDATLMRFLVVILFSLLASAHKKLEEGS